MALRFSAFRSIMHFRTQISIKLLHFTAASVHHHCVPMHHPKVEQAAVT